MFVRIIMENENDETQYEIEREIIIKKSGVGTDLDWNPTLLAKVPTSITATQAVKFAYRDPDTDELIRVSAPDLVRDRLKVLFPEILSSYILFDAELLKAFETQNEDVLIQDGIETITGLPIVDSARKNLEKENKRTFKNSVGAKAEAGRLMTNVEKGEDGIKKIDIENAEDGKKIIAKEKQIAEITKFLINHVPQKV